MPESFFQDTLLRSPFGILQEPLFGIGYPYPQSGHTQSLIVWDPHWEKVTYGEKAVLKGCLTADLMYCRWHLDTPPSLLVNVVYGCSLCRTIYLNFCVVSIKYEQKCIWNIYSFSIFRFDPCALNPCGPNTECSVSGQRSVCRCIRGYTGSPNSRYA